MHGSPASCVLLSARKLKKQPSLSGVRLCPTLPAVSSSITEAAFSRNVRPVAPSVGAFSQGGLPDLTAELESRGLKKLHIKNLDPHKITESEWNEIVAIPAVREA